MLQSLYSDRNRYTIVFSGTVLCTILQVLVTASLQLKVIFCTSVFRVFRPRVPSLLFVLPFKAGLKFKPFFLPFFVMYSSFLVPIWVFPSLLRYIRSTEIVVGRTCYCPCTSYLLVETCDSIVLKYLRVSRRQRTLLDVLSLPDFLPSYPLYIIVCLLVKSSYLVDNYCIL